MVELNKIYNEDCIEFMKKIPMIHIMINLTQLNMFNGWRKYFLNVQEY